ncbi:signal peptidase I [Kocuria rosea]|uniref:signal peptidase I n=1 Tax=Kocuria rosea TaxID=1275 RepID=UPI00068D5CF7|nr:signal peptidase I [Kocuria rosea]MEB2527211.1 signal peptidase I [Kocuria rosea]MEB2619477.1 signal peptidase I [Kocuria rosea]WIG17244.1 signal peptidase I [Kocuria rosea]
MRPQQEDTVRAVRIAARTASRVLLNLAALVVLALALAMLVPGALGYERYVITGASMSGTFEKGTLAIESAVPVADLAVGDVITYLPPPDSGLTELVTHRILTVEESESGPVFRTQGDANADADPWTFQLPGPTQARLDHAVPHLGWAFIALSDPQVRQFVIGVPAGLIALRCAIEVVQVLRRPRPRTATPQPSAATARKRLDGPPRRPVPGRRTAAAV